MDIKEIEQKIQSEEYDFLRTDERLGKNIILMGLGGSHAYGLATPTSDLDIRGMSLDSADNILMGKSFQSFENNPTDTKIYSFIKNISMLRNCNPNVMEMLGLEPWQYLVVTATGKKILDNKDMFISQLAATTYGAYANSQLSKLYHKSMSEIEQAEIEKHLLKTMEFMSRNFSARYPDMKEGSLRLYVDVSAREDRDTEIYMDVDLKHYPVRDYCSMWNELKNTAKQYDEKLGKRNKHVIEHNKLGKHMSMLFYLYEVGMEILQNGTITTYRPHDIPFLREVRAGKFSTENNEIRPEFFDVLSDYEKRFEYAVNNTSIPVKPDDERINEFIIDIHRLRVMGAI